jgi:hypothetical protein
MLKECPVQRSFPSVGKLTTEAAEGSYNRAASLVNLKIQESAFAMKRGGCIQMQQIQIQRILFVSCRLNFMRSISLRLHICCILTYH